MVGVVAAGEDEVVLVAGDSVLGGVGIELAAGGIVSLLLSSPSGDMGSV